MSEKPYELRSLMQGLVAGEIERLIGMADLYVFALYDPEEVDAGPMDFRAYDREDDPASMQARVSFDYDGIGVWYICNRSEDRYSLRKVLVRLAEGRFVHGQVDGFEGPWDDFARMLSDDAWVKAQAGKPAADLTASGAAA